MKDFDEGIIEKKFVVGETINAVGIDGQGAVYTRYPNVTVSDFAKLLGAWKLDYYMDDEIMPLLVRPVVVPGRYGGKFDGARPVLNIKELIKNGVNITKETKEVYYGEFPQTIVRDKELSNLLEEKYNSKSLWKSERKFTLPSGDNTCNYSKITEYEFNGKKYVRVTSLIKLKDANLNDINDIYWVEVEPIKWEIQDNRAITSNILISDLCYCMAHAYMEEFKRDIISSLQNRKDRLTELIEERERINKLIEELQSKEEKRTL